MVDTEAFLRTADIGRPEPDAAVLDRLEAEGHARRGFCDKCWTDSHLDASAYLDQLDGAEVEAAQR